MNSIHVRLYDFIQDPTNFAIPLCGKEALKNPETIQKIIHDIREVCNIVGVKDHIERKDRDMICCIMALYYLVNEDSTYLDRCMNVANILVKPIPATTHIDENIRLEIKSILMEFSSILSNLPSGDIHKIGKLNLNKITAFDSFMMKDKPTLKDEICNKLINHGVWSICIKHHEQKVHISGELPEEELIKNIPEYNKDVFIYSQEDVMHITPDVAQCFHSGLFNC
jgi:hypothetical protein